MKTNLNVRSSAPPHNTTIAWDWPSIEGGCVSIWRGVPDSFDLLLDLAPADPDEAAQWLESLAYAIRSQAARLKQGIKDAEVSA